MNECMNFSKKLYEGAGWCGMMPGGAAAALFFHVVCGFEVLRI